MLFENGPMMTPGGEPRPQNWADLGSGYWVSNEGMVWSEKSHKVMSISKNGKRGYPSLRLSRGSKDDTELVNLHRLLAENFVPNPDNLPVVRHLDDDPDNYDLENLEWGTSKDNFEDAVRNGRRHLLTREDSEKGNVACRKPVAVIDKATGDKHEYGSLLEAANAIGYTSAYVCKCLKGSWTSKQYDFEYI